MKLRLEARPSSVAVIGANWTDAEVLRHVQHEFPDLSGALLEMFQRFERLVDQPKILVDDLPTAVNCPCCGTQLNLVQE